MVRKTVNGHRPSASKPFYEYRNEFRADRFSSGVYSLGEAQSSPIASLTPRSRGSFEVTIPNVKQTKEGLRIGMTFTGERYSYQF
jgi:hypothetical protein